MPRPSRLANLALSDIHAELARRQARAGVLRGRRDRLLAQAAAIDRELAALGDEGRRRSGRSAKAVRGRRGPRGPRSGPTLGNTLVQVLGDRVMTVTEAVEAVKKAGFETKAKAKGLYVMVNAALGKSGRFRRVGRGRYRAR